MVETPERFVGFNKSSKETRLCLIYHNTKKPGAETRRKGGYSEYSRKQTQLFDEMLQMAAVVNKVLHKAAGLEERMEEVKKCSVCGKCFVTNKRRVVCCSKECQSVRNKQIQNMARRKYVSQKETKRKAKSIAEIESEARAAGMHYGQYVAIYGL